MSGVEALARVLADLVAPSQHGQHCPVWTQRDEGAKSDVCDCWQIEAHHLRAERILADPGPLLAALAEAGVLEVEMAPRITGRNGRSVVVPRRRRYVTEWRADD